jgi:hypothetical protein
MFTVNLTDGGQRRAKAKAESRRPETIEAGESKYIIGGSQGDYYDVTVRGSNVDCNCMAGRNGVHCYHAFAALARHAERAAEKSAAAAGRDQSLRTVEADLRLIGRQAAEMSGDFEISEAIGRAVRAALATLSAYEAGLAAAPRRAA